MKRLQIKVDNNSFHGYEIGDSGLPLMVCLHGMTGDSNSFLGLIDYLKNAFHLILLDLPGHGETNALKLEEDYRFSSLAKRIYSVIRKLTDEPFYLLGHSWGADLSLNVAANYPNQILGVVLIDGGYVFPEHVEGMTEGRAISGWKQYIEGSIYSSWDKVIDTYKEYTTTLWNDKLDSIVSSNFIKINNNYVLSADPQSILATIKAFFLEPCSSIFYKIKCPVLLFHSTIPEEDLSRNNGIRNIKSSIVNVKTIGIKNTKHNIHWDNPETVFREIMTWEKETCKSRILKTKK